MIGLKNHSMELLAWTFQLLAILIATTACTSHDERRAASGSPQRVPDLNRSIGWVHGSCLAIRNGNIAPGSEIKLITLGQPQKLVAAHVLAKTDAAQTCPALLPDRTEINKQDGHHFYTLESSVDLKDQMAIGLLVTPLVTTLRNGIIELDLDSNGIAERANSCVTGEGIQFYITDQKTLDDRAIWKDYYYLGYDTEPTCPPMH